MGFGHGDCFPAGTGLRLEMEGVRDSPAKQEGREGFGPATTEIRNPVRNFKRKEGFSLLSQFLEGFVRKLYSPWHA